MTDDDSNDRVGSELRAIRAELADIRGIITIGFDALFASRNTNADAITEAIARLEQVEERLAPTFHKVFPKQQEFISEVDAVLRKPASR